jgi:hypothetical protein
MMHKKYRKFINLLLILFVTVLPIFLSFYPNLNYSLEINSIDIKFEPKLNSFSKGDYKPILEAPEQGLGNINLTRLNFNEMGIINYSVKFPELNDDLVSGALDIIYEGTYYIETVQIAQFNNLNNSIVESDKIVILMNESLSIEYNNSIANSEGFLIYNLRLYPREVKHLLVQNQSSSVVEELNSEDYSLDSDGFIKFGYKNYFKANSHNFSMYIIFEYSLELKNWNIIQDSSNILQMTSSQHTFSPSFSYIFALSGTKYFINQTLLVVPAEGLDVELILKPLDKELFFDHHLKIDNKDVNNFLESDNSLNFTMSADLESFSLDFKLNFTIGFINPVDFTWAIDRLVEGRSTRERIYIPSLISGPQYIYLENVTFIENTITYDQVISNSSVFERDVNYYDVIVSVSQQSVEYSLIFTQNAVKRKGLRLFIPYMIAGETNPFIIKYSATNDLRIILTDNINMPLVGNRIELYYYDKLYGTYISNDLDQPMAPAYSNENGEIIIENVPNGNYTVRIYQNERLIKEEVINTFSIINIIRSNVIHFPLWIIIFGSISSILVIIGLIFYFNYKKNS